MYWGYIGIMEKKMETTILLGVILGDCWSWGDSDSVHSSGHCCFQSLIPFAEVAGSSEMECRLSSVHGV